MAGPADSDVAGLYERQVRPSAPAGLRDALAPGHSKTVVDVSEQDAFYRVPLMAGEKVAGFMDVDPGTNLVRYGFRGDSVDKLEKLPQDLLEMKEPEIMQLVRDNVGGEPVGPPHLVTLDGGAQVAWEVTVDGVPAYVTPGVAWQGGGGGEE